jgi:endonuclease-3 related protein
VVGRGVNPAKVEQHWSEFLASPLKSAVETAACGLGEIQELLAPIGRVKQSAPVLKSLAGWWLKHGPKGGAGEGEGLSEQAREKLLRIPGVSLELADRILLFAAGQVVYPVDRATIRIACRHGWLGLEAEYEEWQASFVGSLSEHAGGLEQFSLWAAQVGKDYCGPQPNCTTCPLRSLLPENGPYDFNDA